MNNKKIAGEVLLYKTDGGHTRIEVRMVGDTVWLSLNQMADLFDRDKSVISKHITNLFTEKELEEKAVVAKYATTAADGKTYQVEHFNLDVIISVGYRVKSKRGTQFRIWATERLREYLVKGFTMDDELLKRGGGGNYFDELLDRIRDIRSSERVFWRKVLDIYASSIDYSPDSDVSKQFFATVQNKMHWAVYGNTAAEVIKKRADATLPNMGLTSWTGSRPKKSDASVAKNYLVNDELAALNLIVSAYLDFAELQAQGRKPMYMKDWINKLDGFLKLSERDVLTHAGKVSHDDAIKKAESEFEKYRARQGNLPSPVDHDFERALDEVKKISGKIPKKVVSRAKKNPRK